LGGMTTLIGTPPNLIVSGFREASGAGAFGMFDFTPVGLAVATVGVLFISLVGWRLVPKRERAGVEGFDTGAYLAEARVTENSKSVGKTLREIGPLLEESDAQIVGMVRNDYRVTVPYPGRRLRPGDILVVEAEPSRLASALNALGLSLVDDMRDVDEQRSPSGKASEKAERTLEPPRDKSSDKKKSESDEVVLMELAVRPDADLIGRSATDIRLRSRFGVNLLAFSRQGHRSVRRLRSEAFRAGDVLLLQGPPEFISAFASEYGCVPLADRPIRIPARREAVLSISIMAASVGSAAIGLAPAAVCFALGVFVSMVLRVMPRRKAYEAIDWPVIILLGALMPVATAMETTGTASLIANGLLTHLAGGNAVIALVLILVVTMTLSDVMNNAATAAVMCPVALGAAAQLGVNSDTLLMAVAVGSSCAFLTPIGHQNNVLILGPGGLRFGDYWRLGLPLELIVVATSIPLLLIFWPL